MQIIEMEDWEECETIFVKANVITTDSGRKIEEFQKCYSNQFDFYDLISDISQSVGQEYPTHKAYINRIEITGIRH